MSKSLYSGVNKVYFRSYLLLNIVASSAYIHETFQERNTLEKQETPVSISNLQ